MATTAVELGDLVLRLVRELRRGARGSAIPPHQLRALRVIAEAPIRPARLAEALGITPRAVTDVVDALIAAGFVEAAPDPDDRRAKILSITPAGEEQRAMAKARRDATAEALFAPLTDDERRELAGLLDKVLGDAP